MGFKIYSKHPPRQMVDVDGQELVDLALSYTARWTEDADAAEAQAVVQLRCMVGTLIECLHAKQVIDHGDVVKIVGDLGAWELANTEENEG